MTPAKPWSGSFSMNRMDSDNDNFSDGLWTGSTAATTLTTACGQVWLLMKQQNHRLGFALEHEDVDFSQRGEASIYGDPNQDQSYDVNGYALEYIGKPLTGFTWTASVRLDDYSDFDNATTWQLAGSYQSHLPCVCVARQAPVQRHRRLQNATVILRIISSATPI